MVRPNEDKMKQLLRQVLFPAIDTHGEKLGGHIERKKEMKLDDYTYEVAFKTTIRVRETDEESAEKKVDRYIYRLLEELSMVFTTDFDVEKKRKRESDVNMEECIDMVELIQELKGELEEGDTTRTQAFLDHILSNGDVMEDLRRQLEKEGF